jgi:hypothetical protein
LTIQYKLEFVLSSTLLLSLSKQALAQVNSSFLTYTNTDLGFTTYCFGVMPVL